MSGIENIGYMVLSSVMSLGIGAVIGAVINGVNKTTKHEERIEGIKSENKLLINSLRREFEEHKNIEEKLDGFSKDIITSVSDTTLKGFTQIVENVLKDNHRQFMETTKTITDSVECFKSEIIEKLSSLDKRLEGHIQYQNGVESKNKN